MADPPHPSDVYTTHPCRVTTDGQRLWKIDRKFYALEPFAARHPGGQRVLNLARDFFDDSTFAFESHHTDLPRVLAVLKKYEVHDPVANGVHPDDLKRGPTMSPKGSFGAVLKTRVREYLRTTENGDGPTPACVRLFFATLFGWFAFLALTVAHGSVVTAALTGGCGAILAGFGHNWVHQPKYHGWAWVLDLEGLNGDTWYMGHLLMHHMYTNLPADSHFTILEPFLVTNPTKTGMWAQRAIMPFVAPLLFIIASFAGYLAFTVRILFMLCGVQGHADPDRKTRHDRRPELDVEIHFFNHNGHPTWLLNWCQLFLLMYTQGGVYGASLFFVKNGVCSMWYLVNAFANHNSEAAWRIDERAGAQSWAEAQLYACSDIGMHEGFYASAAYLWLNYHTVHHLFPHTCMSKHPGIQRVLEQCCDEFGIQYCRGKSLLVLCGEMYETFRAPRDLANKLAEVVM